MQNSLLKKALSQKHWLALLPAIVVFSALSSVCASENALRFNDASSLDQRVVVSSAGAYGATGPFTVQLWFRRLYSTAPTIYEHLISRDNVTKTAGWALEVQPNSALLRFELFGVTPGLSSNTPVLDTAWHHVAVTRDINGLMNMYVDGNLDASLSVAAPAVASAALKLGNSENGANGFEGELDEVQIWNFDRTQSSILSTRRLPLIGNETGLIGYWSMNEGSGQLVADKSPTGANGVRGISPSSETQDPSWFATTVPFWGTGYDATAPTGRITFPFTATTPTIQSLTNIIGTSADNIAVQNIGLTIKRGSDNFYWSQLTQQWIPTIFYNSVNASASWTFSASAVTWAPGFYTIGARFTDIDSNMFTDTSFITVSSAGDTTPPSVSIYTPGANVGFVDSSLLTLSGGAGDDTALSGVNIRITRLSDNLDWNGSSVLWTPGPITNNVSGLANWNYTVPIIAWAQGGNYSVTVTAFDTSNNHNSATQNFSILGAVDDSLQFNNGVQTHQRATVPSLALYNANASFTIEFWLRRHSAGTPMSDEYLISKDNTTKSTGWAIYLQNATGLIRFDPLGVGGGLTSTTAILDTNWHHFALTRNSSGFSQIFIDGNYDSSSNTNAPAVNSSPLKFANSENTGNDLHGDLDEIQFWNYDRVPGDIRCMRRLPLSGFEAGLNGYWNLNESGGQALSDKSPSHNDGYLGISTVTDSSDPTRLAPNIPNWNSACDTVPPTDSIINPAQNSSKTFSALSVISGTAQDVGSGLAAVNLALTRNVDGFFWNRSGQFWSPTYITNAVDGLANWTFPGSSVTWSNSSYTINLQVRDVDGNIANDYANFTVVADSDTTPPSIDINAPVNGTTYTNSQLTILSGTANDNSALARVNVRITRQSDNLDWNATSVSWIAGPINNVASGLSNWQLTIPVSAWSQPGNFSITATAYDAANNSSISARNFSVANSTGSANDVIAPTVQINYPVTGTGHAAASLSTLNGTSDDNSGYSEVKVALQDRSTTKYWDGNGFNNFMEVDFPLTTPKNWSFGVPANSWTDGHSYRLTAIARDGSNNITTVFSDFNDNESLNTDTVPPYINVYTPVDGSVYSPSVLTINGSAGDDRNLASVQVSVKQNSTGLYYNGVSFAAGAQTFFTALGLATWNYNIPAAALTNGSYALQAQAKDAAGNIQNKTVSFTISGGSTVNDTVPPTGAILVPAAGVTYSTPSALANISGTAADDTQLTEALLWINDDQNKFFDGNSWNGTNPIYFNVGVTLNWQTAVPINAWKNGVFTAHLQLRDAANNITTIANQFTMSGITGSGVSDTLPPQVSVSNPTSGASMQPYSFNALSGHADDPSGIANVVLYLKNTDSNLYFNGATFVSGVQFSLFPTFANNTASGMDWSYSIPPAAYVNGNYTLTVEATDRAGNKAVLNIPFTVYGAGAGAGDTTPPTIAITSFQNNATKTSLDMTVISGTANDNSNINQVTLEIQNSIGQWWNATTWQTAIFLMNASGLMNWSLTLPLNMWTDGNYIVKAHVSDFGGNTTQVSNNVTVSGTGTASAPPTVSVTSVIAGQTYVPSSLAIFSGATNALSMRTRITDLNLNLTWDPVRALWVTDTVWSNATVTANAWSSSNAPSYWPNGHFKITAEATGVSGLISIAEADFFVSINTSGGSTDFTPPAAITLSAQPGVTVGSVKLNWTSTGDDGTTGTAAFYAIKYSLAPIIAEADWTNASDVSFAPVNQSPPTPLISGSAQTMLVQNLTPGVAYFWGIRATDHNSNRSVLSNSPLAVAFSGCVAGLGDGEGTAIVSPSSLPASTDTPLTLTYTVGAHGITDGGQVSLRVPDGFIFPQINAPGISGYVSATTSNGSVSLTPTIDGQFVRLRVHGTLNAGDTIIGSYLGRSNSCTIQSGLALSVLSQATSCGIPTEIASQPTVSISAGAASWLGFDNPQKFAQVGQITSLSVRGQSVCGGTAAVGANVNIQASAVIWNSATNAYVPDANAQLSLASNFSSPFSNGNVTLSNGQSSVGLYYRLSAIDTNTHLVRIQYSDINTHSYTLENSMTMVPVAAGQGISNVSVDKGQAGALTAVTFSPATETVFINYQTAANVSSVVSIKQGSTVIQQLWGYGTPVRLSWNGQQTLPTYGTAASGVYSVLIEAAGQQDTSLSVTLQTVGVSGNILSSVGQTAVANANVNIYGPISRVTQTDNSGAFSFNGIPNGQYTLHVEKYGFAAKDVPFTFNGSNLNLGNVLVDALSQLIMNVTRNNTSSELWGSVNTIDPTTQQAIWTSVHFAYGLTTADSGLTTDKPTILLKPSVPYVVNLAMPGYTVTPLTKIWSNGEVYTWTIAPTAKKGVTGSITLANTISNPSGMWITISAVRGTDTTPTKFSSAFIPAGESQTTYSLPDLDAAVYKLTFTTPGLSPTSATITMANVDLVQNMTMSMGGSATLTLSFQGDTSGLDLKDGLSDGKFPVTMRYATDNANGSQTLNVNTNASNTSLVTSVTGLSDGSYKIYFDAVDGFVLNGTSPQILTVTAGVGTLTSNFIQNSGVLTGTLTLPTGAAMNNMNFYLTNAAGVRANPTISGNQFTFSNLSSGKYSLSIFNTLSSASKSQDVFISNGQTTTVAIDMSALQTFSVAGTVRTAAAPPKDSLTTINANSTALTFYTATGQVSVPALSVFAKLILPDGTVAPLPTISGSVLDPAKLKYATINTVTGAYQIDGLEKGKSYRVGLNTDLDADGKSDIPQNDTVLSPVTNQAGIDFTILDGGKIDVTIASPNSESGYALTLQLIDADRKISLQQQTISLVGTTVSAEFQNLQAGRYLVTIADNNSPAKYSVTPQFVSLENITTTKAVTMMLVGSGRMQVTLANRLGTLITAANASQLLPAGTMVQLVSPTQNVVASLDSADGKYKTVIQPGIDYTMTIAPPANISDSDADKAFLPIQKNVRIDNSGAVLDLGVVVLAAGVQVSGTVKNDDGTGIAHAPVFAYQSLSPSVAPVEVFSNDQGIFNFTNLSPINRFYDFIVNPTGDTNSLPNWAEARKTAVDLTKSNQLANLVITLSTVSGVIKGKAVSGSGALFAGYGDKAGQPGVSVVITARQTKRVFDLLSDPDGSFSVALPAGSYDVELIAQNYQSKKFANQSVSDATVDLGSIEFDNTGISLNGKIRNADGTLPVEEKITNLIALDGLKNRYLASLNKVSNGTLENIESYVFYGLSVNTAYDIIALDASSRAKILKKALMTSNVDSSFDLTYTLTDPTMYANFTLKVPEKNEIDLRLGCNQAFRNKDTDADGNGIADDEELNKFVSLVQGKGTLTGNSFSADRYSVDYTYTLGDETGVEALTVAANFHTSEINSKTGDNFSVTGQFSHPFGILAQNTNPISKSEGGKLTLTNGAAVTIPNGALTSGTDDDITVGFRQADDVTAVGNINTSANKNARAAATIARAQQFGAKAYPVGMYKAIQALDSLPTVNPFASFYDIFLPAGVSHVFGNGYQPTLTLKYDDNADPTQINVYYFNEAQNVYTLENSNKRIDTLNHLISVDIGHFSVFTVLASSASVIRSSGYSGELDVFNFPNPFDLNTKTVTLQNPGSSSASQNIQGTMIKIDLPSTLSGSATIKIFDMAGELVRTLHANDLTSLTHNYIEWDGTNDHGEKVASGVYIGRLEIGSQTKMFKMAVVK